MKTLLQLIMTLSSAIYCAQTIPDFNTKFENKNSNKLLTVSNSNLLLRDSVAIIPSNLKDDMKNLLNIEGEVAAYASAEYSKVTQKKIETLEEMQKCLKISEIKSNDPCLTNQSDFNEKMKKYGDSIQKFKALNEYFTYVQKSETETSIINTYDTGSILVPIPQYLQPDMQELMGIKENEVSAFACDNLRTIVIKRIDELGQKRKIYSNADTGQYSRQMIAYDKLIARYKALKTFFKTANSLGGTPNYLSRLLPLRSVMSAKYFFLYNNDEESVMFINKVGIQSNFSSSFSANADVVSGVIFPFKFTMATNISQQTSEKDSVATSKLMNGGLLNISLITPIIFSKWYIGNGKKVIIYIPVEYRFNVDDIKDKVAFNSTYNYHELSGYIMGTVDLLQKESIKDEATLFGAVKHSYFIGGSQFQSKISDNKFWLTQLTVGIKIKNKYTLSANIPIYSTSSVIKKQQAATVGITFEPGN
ncbi:hypothetical protein SAMN05421789_10728 [Kaistella chaponensis]|uniref:Uncharacterized protein n=1 Tax=Kaistella chaponensis TaxID=713588 RepID=A0A1N7M242_9FLAO|nr:hypothetical protein [Kaistella chaponensis]SIS80138.1 hypothetical protein SAMN05421789_10728 [Kaistella chaponensis]